MKSILASLILTLLATSAAADEPRSRAFWKNGFRIEHVDAEAGTEYRLRLRTAMEFRYTYAITDHDTQPNSLASAGERPGNGEDFSAFNMRRLRLYVDGCAPNRDWTYFIHVQLEPNGGVNAHDGTVQWRPIPEVGVRFGRMKIPAFGLEFWQSGFKLNGTDRLIFTGDSENDKDLFGSRTYDFPSGNARLRVGSQRLSNGFSTGGFTLYRSQGLDLSGVIDLFGHKQLLAYSAGVYNGRDSRGFSSAGRGVLTALRLGINFLPGSDPAGPLGPRGLANYTMQGDLGYNTSPLAALLLSSFWDRQQATTLYVPDPDEPGFMGTASREHTVDTYGFSGTLLFRYHGFSADFEYAWEEFIQDPDGVDEAVWDRWALRLNLGQFVVPHKLEATAKAAYVVRLDDSHLENSIESGLGLIQRNGGWLIEDNLQEYRVGVNWYLDGYNQMIALDVSWLRTQFDAFDRNDALRVLGLNEATTPDLFPDLIDIENDIRLRVMYQYVF